MADNPWCQNEKEYCAYLAHERHMFAWCLSEIGGFTSDEAHHSALKRYPYEPPGDEYRGLIFHDEAWHYAMWHLHGEQYWASGRASSSPSIDYRAESDRLSKATG